jgi:hypothetical protein
MITRAAVVALVGLGLLAGSPAGHASNLERDTTLVRFSGPVALPGVTLRAGSYVFEVANPHTSKDVVVVRDRNRTKVYFLGYSQPIDPPRGHQQVVTLSEPSHGEAPRVLAWYPEDAVGHRFVYR